MRQLKKQYKFNSSIGPLYLIASTVGMQKVSWTRQTNIPLLKFLDEVSPEIFIIKQAVNEITEFLNGERQYFNIPLDITGTDFQKKVWHELTRIPYGETRSYKEVAESIKTKAIRAVGTANGRNPLCLIIPCHRVITCNNKLGGYSGGVKIKQQLLSIEETKTIER